MPRPPPTSIFQLIVLPYLARSGPKGRTTLTTSARASEQARVRVGDGELSGQVAGEGKGAWGGARAGGDEWRIQAGEGEDSGEPGPSTLRQRRQRQQPFARPHELANGRVRRTISVIELARGLEAASDWALKGQGRVIYSADDTTGTVRRAISGVRSQREGPGQGGVGGGRAHDDLLDFRIGRSPPLGSSTAPTDGHATRPSENAPDPELQAHNFPPHIQVAARALKVVLEGFGNMPEEPMDLVYSVDERGRGSGTAKGEERKKWAERRGKPLEKAKREKAATDMAETDSTLEAKEDGPAGLHRAGDAALTRNTGLPSPNEQDHETSNLEPGPMDTPQDSTYSSAQTTITTPSIATTAATPSELRHTQAPVRAQAAPAPASIHLPPSVLSLLHARMFKVATSTFLQLPIAASLPHRRLLAAILRGEANIAGVGAHEFHPLGNTGPGAREKGRTLMNPGGPRAPRLAKKLMMGWEEEEPNSATLVSRGGHEDFNDQMKGKPARFPPYKRVPMSDPHRLPRLPIARSAAPSPASLSTSAASSPAPSISSHQAPPYPLMLSNPLLSPSTHPHLPSTPLLWPDRLPRSPPPNPWTPPRLPPASFDQFAVSTSLGVERIRPMEERRTRYWNTQIEWALGQPPRGTMGKRRRPRKAHPDTAERRSADAGREMDGGFGSAETQERSKAPRLSAMDMSLNVDSIPDDLFLPSSPSNNLTAALQPANISSQQHLHPTAETDAQLVTSLSLSSSSAALPRASPNLKRLWRLLGLIQEMRATHKFVPDEETANLVLKCWSQCIPRPDPSSSLAPSSDSYATGKGAGGATRYPRPGSLPSHLREYIRPPKAASGEQATAEEEWKKFKLIRRPGQGGRIDIIRRKHSDLAMTEVEVRFVEGLVRGVVDRRLRKMGWRKPRVGLGIDEWPDEEPGEMARMGLGWMGGRGGGRESGEEGEWWDLPEKGERAKEGWGFDEGPGWGMNVDLRKSPTAHSSALGPRSHTRSSSSSPVFNPSAQAEATSTSLASSTPSDANDTSAPSSATTSTHQSTLSADSSSSSSQSDLPWTHPLVLLGRREYLFSVKPTANRLAHVYNKLGCYEAEKRMIRWRRGWRAVLVCDMKNTQTGT